MRTLPLVNEASPGNPNTLQQSCRDECIYKTVTLAAMLLLLVSLWAF